MVHRNTLSSPALFVPNVVDGRSKRRRIRDRRQRRSDEDSRCAFREHNTCDSSYVPYRVEEDHGERSICAITTVDTHPPPLSRPRNDRARTWISRHAHNGTTSRCRRLTSRRHRNPFTLISRMIARSSSAAQHPRSVGYEQAASSEQSKPRFCYKAL